MNHRALGGRERALVLALRCDLLEFFACCKKPGTLCRAPRQKQPAYPGADLQHRQEKKRNEFQHPSQMRQSAERKPPKKRLRQQGKQEEIHRERDYQRDKKSGIPQRVQQLPRQQEQTEDVGRIGEEQNGQEQPFRMVQ